MCFGLVPPRQLLADTGLGGPLRKMPVFRVMVAKLNCLRYQMRPAPNAI